jgi:hypothetical protein
MKITYYERTRTTTMQHHYGFWKFIGDCLMVGLTGGLWLIWIFVREMRKR